MVAASFVMRFTKSTSASNCFKERGDRIGRVYLHPDFISGNKINVQIAGDYNNLSADGYQTIMTPYKKTLKKVRYCEDVSGGGELGSLYVSKEVLAHLGLGEEDRIAVRIAPEVGDNVAAMG